MDQFHTNFGEPVKNKNNEYVLDCLKKTIESINGIFIVYGVNDVTEADNLRTVILQHIQRSSKLNAPKNAVGRPKKQKTVIRYEGQPL